MPERAELVYRHLVGSWLLRPAAGRRLRARHRRVTASAAGRASSSGMTLYNNARHLPRGARLAAGADATATSRWSCWTMRQRTTPRRSPAATRHGTRGVRYLRHATRQAMVATWRDVVEFGARGVPDGGVLRLGQRPRSLASALAGAAGRRARCRPRRRCSPIRSPAEWTRRRALEKGATAVRHGRLPPTCAPRWRHFCRDGRRLGRHGLRPHAAGRAAARRRVPPRAASRQAADGRADAAGTIPPGAGGVVVPAPVRDSQRRAAAVHAGARRRRAARVRAAAVAAARAGAVAGVRGAHAAPVRALHGGVDRRCCCAIR